MRSIDPAGFNIVKTNEGCLLHSYQDVAGVWTIGYGHTPARPGQTITQAEADALLIQDLQHAEVAVDSCTSDVPTTDNQFSAMVSLAFNIGTGAFHASSVLRDHRGREYGAAANAFLLWDKAHINGQLVMVRGLLRRRNEERDLYLSP